MLEIKKGKRLNLLPLLEIEFVAYSSTETSTGVDSQIPCFVQ